MTFKLNITKYISQKLTYVAVNIHILTRQRRNVDLKYKNGIEL